MSEARAALPSAPRRVSRPAEVTTLASAAPRRPIVVVLGMHRSGTSLCSHVLSALGVDMVDRVEGPGHEALTAENAKGHWERWEIVALHDRILKLFDRGYYEPTHDFPLPVAWWADPRVAALRREIAAFLEARMGKGLFGFKDPRLQRLLPVWHQLFDELKLAPKIVLCLRNPAQVARSLEARDGLDPDIGEYRWFTYTIDFFRYVKNLDVCTIEYESWFDDPSINLTKLQDFLDLSWHQSEFELDATISGILDPELRHDGPVDREPRQPLVRSLYKLAREADRNAASRDQIQRLAAQFVGFQQLQRGLQRGFEHALSGAARKAAVEKETAALLAALDEHQTLLQEANEKLEAREAAAQRDAESSRQAIAAVEAELARLRDALSQAEQEMWQRAGAAETMRAEIAMLRDSVFEAERRLRQDALDTARLRADAAELRVGVEQALRAAEDRAALEGRIASLESALAAARRVGRAALDALAQPSVVAAPAETATGWRNPFKSIFRLRQFAKTPAPDRVG